MDSQRAGRPEIEAAVQSAFPIVGIGASAGGFPALITLLENMPAAPGMALVIVLHLSPHEPSSADRVLQRATDMPVVQVRHATVVLPDHVYVIPPDRSLRMQGGCLVLDRLERRSPQPVAIDVFFRSLAEAHREQAVGIVLSGMGSDGTAGLACIREMGGVTIAQLPADAESGAMPRSAIESGMADFVLPAAQMPGKLIALRDAAQRILRRAQHGNVAADAPPFDLGPAPQASLAAVLETLHERTGHDFADYKPQTLLRRIERRMQVRGAPDLPSYLLLLKRDGSEPQALLRDLLIGVTCFFRDRDAFDALERMVVPAIVSARGPAEQLRAWSAACSTGEEAYTLAILLADAAGTSVDVSRVQVFASDLDAHAIDVARIGLYPATIVDDVPRQRLQRYFTREGEHYRVHKSLRQLMLFARHNLLHDPAFSRLDLITCRNFLIYVNREVHRYLMQVFHFALNPGGYLMLGSAESAEPAAELFATVDAKHRIYQARPVARSAQRLPAMRSARQAAIGSSLADAAGVSDTDAAAGAALGDVLAEGRRGRMYSVEEIHLHKAAEQAAPSILVDADAQILHVSERAAHFLRHHGGEPTRDLTSLALPPLRLQLRAALFAVQRSGAPAVTDPVRFALDGAEHAVELRVLPFEDAAADGRMMLVQFIDLPQPLAAPTQGAPAASTEQALAGLDEHGLLWQLDEELLRTRRRLHDTIEEAESSDAELRARGEELQTMVEELRASLDETAHGRQQLESMNLELMTVNRQLQLKIAETAKAHDDLANLIASSDVATLFLDRDMRILRYTPRIADIFRVIAADVGRPLAHISCELDDPGLAAEAARVFETLQSVEREVRGKNGRYYIARVLPYRTGQDRIEGAVMSFFDISDRRAVEEALRLSEDRHRADLERQVRERTAELRAKHDLLQATMDASMDMIQVFEAVRDGKGEIVDFRWILNNHAAQRQYGDVLGKSLLRNNPGVVEAGIFDAFRGVVETGAPDQAERHYVHEQFDGWFLQTAVRLGDGVATTTKDVTAWKRSQEQVLRLLEEVAQAGLRESEQRFGALVGDFAQAVWETDAQGRVTGDSPSWRAFTGQTLQQWLETGWTGAVHPQDSDEALRQWQEAVAAGQVFDAEFRLRRAAGGWRRTRVRAAPLFNADGSLRAWVGMNVDLEGRRWR